MKNKLFAFILLLTVSVSAMGQKEPADRELSALLDVVKMLRTSNQATYDKARKILSDDMKWTAMDETGNIREGKECKASESVARFKLNRILFNIAGSRKHVSSHGDMVNGENAGYDYSLYERALKPKTDVSYNLKGREGKQTFVIVPFDKQAVFKAWIVFKGKKTEAVQTPDGTYTITWDKNLPTKDQTFSLYVKNGTAKPQSLVIINHNSRKK